MTGPNYKLLLAIKRSIIEYRRRCEKEDKSVGGSRAHFIDIIDDITDSVKYFGLVIDAHDHWPGVWSQWLNFTITHANDANNPLELVEKFFLGEPELDLLALMVEKAELAKDPKCLPYLDFDS